jgi:hypothetical protein
LIANHPIQLCIECKINFTHPSRAELRVNLIAANLGVAQNKVVKMLLPGIRRAVI